MAVPELPEVETVRRDLDATIPGRLVVSVSVTGRRSVRRQSADAFAGELLGRTCTGTARRGKYLLLVLDNGAVLVVHLRMSGQLLLDAQGADTPLVMHTHVVLDLDDGRQLRFVDPRTFGEMWVATDTDDRGVPVELAGLGIDPLIDDLTATQLSQLLTVRRTSMKAFLLDQRILAGIGNMYADEICFRAHLRPDRRTDSLDRDDSDQLYEAVMSVLSRAVELRGSTLRDARYRDLYGAHGDFQREHAVYARAGQPCPRCGGEVVRSVVAGRGAHFCPGCQR